VYEKKPKTTVDLKQNIRGEVAAVSSNMLPAGQPDHEHNTTVTTI
jgi:hypothetical protein